MVRENRHPAARGSAPGLTAPSAQHPDVTPAEEEQVVHWLAEEDGRSGISGRLATTRHPVPLRSTAERHQDARAGARATPRADDEQRSSQQGRGAAVAVRRGAGAVTDWCLRSALHGSHLPDIHVSAAAEEGLPRDRGPTDARGVHHGARVQKARPPHGVTLLDIDPDPSRTTGLSLACEVGGEPRGRNSSSGIFGVSRLHRELPGDDSCRSVVGMRREDVRAGGSQSTTERPQLRKVWPRSLNVVRASNRDDQLRTGHADRTNGQTRIHRTRRETDHLLDDRHVPEHRSELRNLLLDGYPGRVGPVPGDFALSCRSAQ